MPPPRPTLRAGRPLWLPPGAARRARTYPALRGRVEADVAIVGGGITGSLAALRFAEAGAGVVVLEADRVAHGSTAASSALLLHEPDLSLVDQTARYGTRQARRIWRASHAAARDLIRLLGSLPAACALERRDTVHYTVDAGGVPRLRAEFEARQRAGVDVEWLTAGALRREAGIPARAGLRTRGSAQCDPYRACRGVMASAVRAGAAVHEGSGVGRIERLRHGVRVHTARGVVDARQVVVATGYATPAFRPLAGRFALTHTYVFATPPLDAAARREIGLGDVLLWEARRSYHYARWTADHRLLLGGGDRPIVGGQSPAARVAAAAEGVRGYFEGLLPALGEIAIAQAWEGRFANTRDSLPYIGPHRRYPHHVFALGYGGNGMTFAALAARLLVEQWRGGRSADHALFTFDR
jgi:glycine/D-amino acid oxidase-like deaminating enzyme